MEWVETTGRTVGEALDLALDRLGVDEHDVEYEILVEPKAGLFGRFGGTEARIRARVKPLSRRSPESGVETGVSAVDRTSRRRPPRRTAERLAHRRPRPRPTQGRAPRADPHRRSVGGTGHVAVPEPNLPPRWKEQP